MMNIHLQKRDIKILKYISDVDYTDFDSIRSVFFSNRSLSACKNIVYRLKNADLIRSFFSKYGKNIFQLTDEGVSVVRHKFPDEYALPAIKRVNHEHLDHSLGISHIRSVLEKKLEIINFDSDRKIEFLMKTESEEKIYVPDGLVKLKSGIILILEYERTRKSKARIEKRIDEVEELISHHYQNDNESKCLIVCESEAIKRVYIDRNLNSLITILTKDDLNNYHFKEFM